MLKDTQIILNIATEQQLIAASNKLERMKQPYKGYWFASDVSRAIGKV